MSQANDSTRKSIDLNSIRESDELESVIHAIESIPSLAYPPILFPDLAYKPRTESPASMAVATQNTLVPTLTAPSLGCSMGVIATNLTKEDITPEFCRIFYTHMQDELSKSYSVLKNIFVWLGFIKRPLKKYDLTIETFLECIKRGAPAAIQRYGLPKHVNEVFDNRGSLFSSEEQETLDVSEILPRSSFTNGRHNLGYGFHGNHFLEIQYVEEIYDEQTARKIGLEKNQVVIMYHGGGGIVPYHIGRYFGSRQKNTFKQKFFQIIGKIFFHFFSRGGVRHFRERFQYYFRQTPLQEIPLNSTEGKRLMQATKASLNYSYVFDVAIYKRVLDALSKTLKGNTADARLVVGKLHNTITEEVIDKTPVVVHRHTVTRVTDGDPTIISGFNNTCSYIAVGSKGAAQHLFSVDHGSGRVHKYIQENLAPVEHTTTIYKTKKPQETNIQHVSGGGIEKVLDVLEKNDVARRAIKLRPLATFKG